jgi:hypothetical protein
VTSEHQFEVSWAAEEIVALRSNARTFGFACLENALGGELFELLSAEAAARRLAAEAVSDDGAAGVVPHASRRAHLGPAAKAFLTSPSIATLLSQVFGEAFILTDDASCYTYYDASDFIGAHRDRAGDCGATIIVYLAATSPDRYSPQSGLSLRLLGDGAESTSTPTAVIPTMSGSVVVGRGSRTWHDRPRLQEGESVIALTACFSSVPEGTR